MMRRIGVATDKIGWVHFTEGKVPLLLRELQDNYLSACPTHLTINVWMRGFITQLLQLTHSQWIYRNISKHHKTNGTLQLAARADVIREIDRQLDTGIGSLPEECKCLLEIPEEDLSA